MNERIAHLARRVLSGQHLSRQEALSLTALQGEDLYDLFYWANKIRVRMAGPSVGACSIVPSKVGSCEENCKFCSQSAHYRTHVKDTTLDTDKIVSAAKDAASQGATCFGLVNSGMGPSDEEIEYFGHAMQQIRKDVAVDLCASLGVLTDAQAQRLAELGVQKYNHNLQTSRRFWPETCSTHSYEQRIETIRSLQRAGIRACCGGLFGMGETWEDRVDLALELRDLGVDTVPINFLIPIAGTPLEGRVELTTMECLRIIALYRFCLPSRLLMICGGREVHLRDLQSWMFLAGASGMLIGNYLTTCGRTAAQDLQMLRDLGLSTRDTQGSCDPVKAVQDQVARYGAAPNA